MLPDGTLAIDWPLGGVTPIVSAKDQVGAKFGRWLDLAFLQLVLDDRAAPDA